MIVIGRFEMVLGIQKRDELEIVTSNYCDWSIWNGHVPKIRLAHDTARGARIKVVVE